MNNQPLLERISYCRGIQLAQPSPIGIEQHQLPPIGDEQHQIPSIGDDQHRLPSIGTEQHQPPPIGDNRHQLPSYRDDCMNNLARDNALIIGDVDIDWQVVLAARWRALEHINSYELRSSSTAIRWLLSHPGTTGTRVMLLSDSQVAVGCMAKGRTSSHVLLRRMRSIASHVLASGINMYCRWIPSELNPADEPSRRFHPLQ
jgi:hypothetical protein